MLFRSANGIVASLITAFKVLLIVGTAAVAFTYGTGPWGYVTASGAGGLCEGVPASARSGLSGFSAAMVGALWSYNGWFVAAQVGEEIRDPGHTLPRALIGSTVLVIALYLLVNAAFYRVLSPVEVASVPESASVAAVLLERVLGRAGAAVTAAAMMLSTFGTLHSSLLTTSQIGRAHV